MALTKSLSRLDHPTLQTHGEGGERETLLALSQRKLNALGMPVCYIDRDQRYRFVNRAFLEWTGKAAGEVSGREIIEVEGRELYQLYHAYIEAALSGERVSFERQLSSAKRNAFWIRVDYYPDRGPRGEIRGLLATYTDVDNIKRLELEAGEREHRLRVVTDSVGLPIFYFDRALRLRFANKPYGVYPARPSATTGESGRRPAICAGCGSHCFPTANREAGPAARSSSSTTSRTTSGSARR